VARELFLPLDRAWWDGGRFTLGRWAGSSPRPALRGVRLHEPSPAAAGLPPERDTQSDLGALVGSVAELRKAPGLSGLVLSDETVVGRERGLNPGKRIVFGLRSPPGDRYLAEAAAAAECHRVLRRAVKRAGYRVEHPHDPPDPSRGFAGLLAWAGAVRLRRRRTEYRWLLLLPLLVLLYFVPWSGRSSPTPPVAAPATPPGPLAVAPRTPSAAPAASPAPAPTPAPAVAPGRGPSPGRPPSSPQEELDSYIKSLEQIAKLDKDGSAGNSNLLSSLGGSGPGRWSQRSLETLLLVSTVAMLLGAAWMLWATEAGIGTVLATLIVPGYLIFYGLAHWSKAWKPLLVHTAGTLLFVAWVYLQVKPYVDQFQGLLG
jgi:hypothetical protein